MQRLGTIGRNRWPQGFQRQCLPGTVVDRCCLRSREVREGVKDRVLNYWFVGTLQQDSPGERSSLLERYHCRRAEGPGLTG